MKLREQLQTFITVIVMLTMFIAAVFIALCIYSKVFGF